VCAGSGDEADVDDTWIRQLSMEQLEECRDAPVLVVAKEKHLIDELRSLLKVRCVKCTRLSHVYPRSYKQSLSEDWLLLGLGFISCCAYEYQKVDSGATS
jgi:hypothetical protein